MYSVDEIKLKIEKVLLFSRFEYSTLYHCYITLLVHEYTRKQIDSKRRVVSISFHNKPVMKNMHKNSVSSQMELGKRVN